MGRVTGVRIFVLNELRNVPEGRVVTLSQLAKLAGVPGARRGVERILKSDDARSAPYWRVVDEEGGLIETVGGGPDHQREKLQSEGVDLSDSDRVDLGTYQYRPE